MKVASKMFIDVPGFGRLETEKGASFNPGGVNRPEVISDLGVAGYEEETVAPMVSCSVIKKAGLSLHKLNNITGATVTVTLNDGSVWIIENAWTSAVGEMSNGRYPLEMKGIRAEEVQA